jgi:hypothetical protein
MAEEIVTDVWIAELAHSVHNYWSWGCNHCGFYSNAVDEPAARAAALAHVHSDTLADS